MSCFNLLFFTGHIRVSGGFKSSSTCIHNQKSTDMSHTLCLLADVAERETVASCCLCGIKLVPGMKRRFQQAGDLLSFVRTKCKETPFVHVYLCTTLEHRSAFGDTDADSSTSTRESICIPCVNWKRRVETLGLRRTKLPMLQLDQLVCFLMQPGTHPEPDHRCMKRLIRSARQLCNPYRSVFPLPVTTILNGVRENTFYDCVRSWWDYNGQTEFFASGQEAKRVRCVVKTSQP